MTFEQAGEQFVQLRAERDAGRMADAAFRAAVARLVVTDAQGQSWQLDPDSAQWFVGTAARTPAPPNTAAVATATTTTTNPSQAVKKRGLKQSTWDAISVIGNAALSAGWYLYSGMAETRPDYLTCGAMLVLPISFVLLRKPLDGVLRSIQPIRSKIPPMVLAGCCVAVPYLITNYLYAFGVREFRFMFCSYVLSTVASFLLMRQPSPASGQQEVAQ